MKLSLEEKPQFISEKPISNPKNAKEHELKYGEILYDKKLVFHGIGFDIPKLRSILENGILSEQAAQSKGVKLTRNYGGYNLENSVSVAESPSINNSFTFGCFGNYIKNGISFVISEKSAYKVNKGSSQYSGYPDEAFIGHEVKKENIVGIMVPTNLLSFPLANLPLDLAKIGCAYTDNRFRRIISDLEIETGYHADTTALEELIKKKKTIENKNLDYVEKHKKRNDIVMQIEKIISQSIETAFAQKLGIDHPTLKDALRLYIPKSIRVYDSNGFDIIL